MRIETDRRYRAVVVALLLVIAAVLAYFVLATPRADPDMFWHIASGRYIVAHHAIPTTDVFSWYGIANGLTWMPQAWLFDLGVFGLWAIGGFSLLYAATALAVTGVIGLLYWLFALRSGDRLLALAAAALTMLGLLPFIAARPQILTYALLLVLALLLEHRKWWWAVPVVLLGANLHGPVYPVYLLVVAYYALPKRWPVLAVCAAAVLATPSGLALLAYPFTSLGGASTAMGIQEFARVAPLDWPFYAVGLLVIVLLLDRERAPLKDLAGLTALVLLSLAAVRHMAFLFVLALPLAAPYLKVPGPDAAGPRSGTAPRSRAFAVIDWALVGVLALGAVFAVARATTLRVDPFADYPVAAADYLQAHGVTRYFNDLSDGGYLIFRGMAPLIDGRGDPFVPYPGGRRITVGAEYARVWYLETDCRPFLDRNGITDLLLRRTSRLAVALERAPDFRVAYGDATYVVYERVAAP